MMEALTIPVIWILSLFLLPPPSRIDDRVYIQGSQWVGCGESLMSWPAYRDAALQVDALFFSLSGWSILEKSKTLAPTMLGDTMYAQPVTFLVQVGLFHLLAQLGITPAMVRMMKTLLLSPLSSLFNLPWCGCACCMSSL